MWLCNEVGGLIAFRAQGAAAAACRHDVASPDQSYGESASNHTLPWNEEFFGCWAGRKSPIIESLTEACIRDYAFLMMKPDFRLTVLWPVLDLRVALQTKEPRLA